MKPLAFREFGAVGRGRTPPPPTEQAFRSSDGNLTIDRDHLSLSGLFLVRNGKLKACLHATCWVLQYESGHTEPGNACSETFLVFGFRFSTRRRLWLTGFHISSDKSESGDKITDWWLVEEKNNTKKYTRYTENIYNEKKKRKKNEKNKPKKVKRKKRE